MTRRIRTTLLMVIIGVAATIAPAAHGQNQKQAQEARTSTQITDVRAPGNQLAPAGLFLTVLRF